MGKILDEVGQNAMVLKEVCDFGKGQLSNTFDYLEEPSGSGIGEILSL